MTAVGVIGGYGAVGRAAVAQLRAWGPEVVVAGRDPARSDVVVDVGEPAALARFCGSVRLVVNCTGAAPEHRARVVEAATTADVPYVDPGGDEPLHRLLGRVRRVPVVLSAGMWPGLTALLPRVLRPAPSARLVCYVGGQDRFSLAGAADYLAAVHDSTGRTFAMWRDGRVERAGAADVDNLPYFPEPVGAVLYLGPELERLARRLDLAELVCYIVFPGRRLRETLAAAGTAPVDARAVVTASELDLFGRTPYQRLVCQLRDDSALPTTVLSGRSAAELTGATAALTALAVLQGDVPAGVRFAADVLDAAWAMDKLRTAAAVTGLWTFDAGCQDSAVEEGVI